jgi:predicted glutamine amidotransferase
MAPRSVTTNLPEHECDLFLLSSFHPYRATNALRSFALDGHRNVHGWGVGGWHGRRAVVVRRDTPAARSGDLADSFAAAVEASASEVLVGHLRLASRGAQTRENNHPFMLHFLGYDWLLAHNGTARSTLSTGEPHLLPRSDVDSARIFEFVRHHMIEYALAKPQNSLLTAVRKAFSKLLSTDPGGKFNLVLSNGVVSFVLVHWRDFYLLRREKDPEDALLASTLRLTEEEPWAVIKHERGPRLLAISGPTLLFNGKVRDTGGGVA